MPSTKSTAKAGAAGTQPPASAARARILDAAQRLFYREGIRAVGVDALIAAAGVATMTFYRHFPSKDALVRAYLEEQDRRMRRRWSSLERDEARPAEDRLREFFVSTAQRMLHPRFRGCPFVNAATEFPEKDSTGRGLAVRNKAALRDFLRRLAKQAGARHPKRLADHLVLLVDGAMASSQTLGPSGPAAALVPSAEAAISASLRPQATR